MLQDFPYTNHLKDKNLSTCISALPNGQDIYNIKQELSFVTNGKFHISVIGIMSECSGVNGMLVRVAPPCGGGVCSAGKVCVANEGQYFHGLTKCVFACKCDSPCKFVTVHVVRAGTFTSPANVQICEVLQTP